MEKITIFEDQHIVLGVTGSIAAYKAVDLASKLTQAGALVDVILTEAAGRFVTPLAFEAVTGRRVYTDMWQTAHDGDLENHIAHIALAETADLMMIAPATAQTLARLAHGFADNLLTLTAIAAECPLIVAPAMDGGMYASAAVQANLDILRDREVRVIEPDEGRFASGLYGRGRLPDTAVLLGHLRQALGTRGALAGQRVVVTAGGTHEAIDPVRYITNRSTGKQGHAVAQAAVDAGAHVVLITTTPEREVPVGLRQLVRVESAQAMEAAVLEHARSADVLIMAAAVADYRPAITSPQKIKKRDQNASINLELVRTPDILMEVQAMRGETGFPRVVVGFAAESENVIANAEDKLLHKELDLLVANDISAMDAGFAVDTNRVTFLSTESAPQSFGLMSKTSVSEAIIARVGDLLTGQT
jgi:phosphopantothenoylcysteine decarboxylase / phosphopantothenate---cysteine ligase